MKKYVMMMAAACFLAACHESLEERAARECKEYTEKYCPAPISNEVVNDSMVYEKASRTVHYYYSLRGIADTTALDPKKARAEMLEAVKNSTELKAYKEAGFNLQYTYYSTKHPGKKMFDLLFTPKDY
ncbi:MAG: hypothetical protein IJ582_02225 [Prevotella sp.]|nr:hypothetical protein [Prevotella sp.]